MSFSAEDYVTDNYLAYQDSLVHSWNVMMSDDNEKLASLRELLTEMQTSPENQHDLIRLEERLGQLHRIRYTQKSMSNSDVIEEYDFASTSLVRELLTLAESRPDFAADVRLQHLVEQIRLAEERVENYRADYDDLVSRYNNFLEANKKYLSHVDRDSLEKKNRFELVSVNR